MSGCGSFWTPAQWAEWSNDLARLVPEEYEDDAAQEAIIKRYLADVPRLIAEAQAAAWAACIQEAEDCGWVHDLAADDMAARNPYRVPSTSEGE